MENKLYSIEEILELINRNDFHQWFIHGDYADYICENNGKPEQEILLDIERMLTTPDKGFEDC